MDRSLRIGPNLSIPGRELTVETSRAGGPGGQNVNKLETRVTLRFHVATSQALPPLQRAWLLERLGSRLSKGGELVIHASRHRTQARNLEDARERLAALIQAALVRPTKRRPTRPTRGSQEKRLRAKRRDSELKRSRTVRED
jgi:ribosome-associated protein